VFGVLGTAFLVAIPLTGLSDLTWPSVAAALAITAVVLVATGLVLILASASEVFITRVGTLTDLHDVWSSLPSRYPEFEILGGVAQNPDDLAREWARAHRERWRWATSSAGTGEESAAKDLAEVAKQRFEEIDSVSTAAVGLATYREMVRVYRWAHQWISGGAVLGAIGAFMFFGAVQSAPSSDAAEDEGSPPAAFVISDDASECTVESDGGTTTVQVPAETTCMVAAADVEEAQPAAEDTEEAVDRVDWLPQLLIPAAAVVLGGLLWRKQRTERRSPPIRDELLESC
jgi:hypothetical protein